MQLGNSNKGHAFYNNRLLSLRFLATFALLLLFLFTIFGESTSAFFVLSNVDCLDGLKRRSQRQGIMA
jgi:hypothetical protein